VEKQLKTMFSEPGRSGAKAGQTLDPHRRSLEFVDHFKPRENAQ
jgi:hypothetical protein